MSDYEGGRDLDSLANLCVALSSLAHVLYIPHDDVLFQHYKAVRYQVEHQASSPSRDTHPRHSHFRRGCSCKPLDLFLRVPRSNLDFSK